MSDAQHPICDLCNHRHDPVGRALFVCGCGRPYCAIQPLTEKDYRVIEQGDCITLKCIHDQLDEVVLDAYGLPQDSTDEQILEHLVALNKDRAAEESRGLVRWLRPEFQNPSGEDCPVSLPLPAALAEEKPQTNASPAGKLPWPKGQTEQVVAVRDVLPSRGVSFSVEDIAAKFNRARRERVEGILCALETIGVLRRLASGRFAR